MYLLDVRLPDGSGIDLLRLVRQWDERSRRGDDLRPRHGGRRGAGDEDRRVRLPREAARARPRAAGRQERARVVGPAAREPALPRAGRGRAADDRVGAAFLQAVRQATQVARSDVTVLLSGESGTGKELLAAHIHRESPFASGPFVKVNCAAIPTELIESELFGHEKGAFTGAAALRRGKFELADGGTIFLDEVGDLHEASQAKLLRVLQDGELQRVGGEQTIRVTARVISATNRRLDELVVDRPVPGGSLLSAERRADSRAVTARAPAGHRRARGVLPFRVLRAEQLPAASDRSGCRGAARPLHLARQRPRAAERRRADGDPHVGRSDHGGGDPAGGADRPSTRAPCRDCRKCATRPSASGYGRHWTRPTGTSRRRRGCSKPSGRHSTSGSARSA